MRFHLPLIATLGFALLSSCAMPQHSQAAPPLIMGYYPSYRTSPSPADIRFDRFTHIIQSFVSADANGKAVATDGLSAQPLVPDAHAKGVKVLLALGGGANGKSFGLMVRDPTKRAQFITDVVKMMTHGAYDGLVIDWEQPEATDKAVTTEFVAQLRAQTRAANPASLLILVVNCKPNNSSGYDGPRLRDNVDYLQVMTYDYHGPWSHAGHHTSLYADVSDTTDGKVLSFPTTVSYWHDVQGFRTDQILLGLAGYGRGFKVSNWYEKPTAPSQYPEISFRDTRALIGHGWTRQWDGEAHAPWLLSDDKTDRISYDDEQSCADKSQWIKQNNLPGFFIWEMTQDYVDGDNLLIAAAQNAWKDDAH